MHYWKHRKKNENLQNVLKLEKTRSKLYKLNYLFEFISKNNILSFQ